MRDKELLLDDLSIMYVEDAGGGGGTRVRGRGPRDRRRHVGAPRK